MSVKVRAGARVLYKNGNSGWLVGTVMEGKAEVNALGVFIPIIEKNVNPEEEYAWCEINELFTDAQPVEPWMKLISKEDYIKIIEDEDFEKNLELAFVSDGEYYYYQVNKFNKNWIMKQPFDYIIRSEM
jgi:hypothetical protein